MIRQAVAKLAEGRNLTKTEAFESMNEIMDGTAGSVLISAFLLGLRSKGETVDEITGCALAMREKAVKITTSHPGVIDTCGTGGDGSGTFNISTAAAILASAAGVPVAKHGNKAVSSSCGSADVLQELGVNIENPPERVAGILEEVGITFLYAPMHHRAMKHAAPVRKELGIRTVFNILGPLVNPAGARRQVLGVFNAELTETLAKVLKELGSEHAVVVHGAGGLDEFSTVGKTTISELKGGNIRTYDVNAGEFGLRGASVEDLKGGDAQVNAAIIGRILNGDDGAPGEIAILNAGAAIMVGGKAKDLNDGVRVAREIVRSGAGKAKLEKWITASRS